MRRPEFIARQSAYPSGLLGRLIGHVMARETAEANRIALELLDLAPTDHVLEIGFGHGATIARVAAAVSGGFVAGVDTSAEMLRMATKRNRSSIARGLAELRLADARKIPYPDGRFDKVLSVHTVYFWPDLSGPLAEASRVLKPLGRLILAYRSDPQAILSFPAAVYRFHSEAEVLDALRVAGFSEVRVVRRQAGAATVCFALARRATGL